MSRVHNLTVDGIHTYHVMAGDDPVLVHNCGRSATEAASPGGRAIVIGEDMEGRVIPKANELGADYYDPPAAPRDQWMENNRKWINDRMDEGCTIYDCGPAPGRANYPSPTSPYYQMELDEIAKRSYPVIRVS
jgi:hypothetical protein